MADPVTPSPMKTSPSSATTIGDPPMPYDSTMCEDWKIVPGTPIERAKLVLDKLKLGGVATNRAVSYLATACNEVASYWTHPRTSDLPITFKMKECWPCRVTIGMELQNRLSNGKMERVFRAVLNTDTDAQAALKSLGCLGPLLDMDDGGKAFRVVGDMLMVDPLTPAHAAARFFEWIWQRRKGKQLEHISIGPTQMYLWYSALCGSGSVNKTFPGTWEDLWLVYASHSAKEILSHIHHCDPEILGGGIKWPYDDDSEANVVKWLGAGQTGASMATAYYNGGSINPVGYKNYLAQLKTYATSKGY
jgi:hypothetical protein